MGPVLFILNTRPLTALIGQHCICHEMFADDTQLSHSESPDKHSDSVCSPQALCQRHWAMDGREETQTE